MWRTVPVLVILVAVPWAAEAPDWFYGLVVAAVAVPLGILPLRPRLVIAGGSVVIHGLISTERLDIAAIDCVGLELRASSLALPTMFLKVRREGRLETVHALCVPADLCEVAATSIDPHLFRARQSASRS